MKIILGGLLLCLAITTASAQKEPFKFGDISLEDLRMTRYDKDSSAAAIVLGDYGHSAITYNPNTWFTLKFERRRRIKILKKEGLHWANFQIPLYREGTTNEVIIGLKAITYNLENGKIVQTKAKSDGLLRDRYSENIDLVKVAFPNVKEGSIIEIEYQINSEFLVNLQDWQFQDMIPVVHSEYRAFIPEFFHYDKYLQGYFPLDVADQTSEGAFLNVTSKERAASSGRGPHTTSFNTDNVEYRENRFRWIAKNVPAFKDEPFITTYKDYITSINFELAFLKFPEKQIEPVLGSWHEINKRYHLSERFGQEVTGNGFLKKIVDEITAGKTEPEDKINAIYSYVQQNVVWNEESYKLTNKSLRKVLDEKNGSSSEINLLLASMLEKANINVNPVLLSTRDHGFVRENIPIVTQFNYVICVATVQDKKILLDATDRLLPAGILPSRCLNGNGLAITKDDPYWIKLEIPAKSRSVASAEFTVQENGALKGKLSLDRSGYSAHQCRKNYFAKQESEYIKEFIGSNAWDIIKSEFQNTKNLNEPFKETHELVINDKTVVGNDVIYLNPLVSLQEIENPFKSETREYPVDFTSPEERMYICRITLPQGYVVDELPKPQIVVLPGNSAKFAFNASMQGDVINVTSQLQINKSLFAQDEYADLRQFYNLVVAKQAEQIVLKKK